MHHNASFQTKTDDVRLNRIVRRIIEWSIAGCLLAGIYLWLKPLKLYSQSTDVYLLKPFLSACIAFWIIRMLHLHAGLRGLCYTLISLGLITMYFKNSQTAYWSEFIGILVQDAQLVLQGLHQHVSPQSRTLVFYIGLACVIEAMYYLSIVKYSASWFVCFLWIYLSTFQWISGQDLLAEIILSFIVGMMTLSLTRLLSFFSEEMLPSTSMVGFAIRWMVFSGMIIIGLAFVASQFASDKPTQSKAFAWQEQLQRFGVDIRLSSLASTSSPTPSSTQALTGFDEDDRFLGSSLEPDDGLVFTAQSERLTYWRGSVKDQYTGSGWEIHLQESNGNDPLYAKRTEEYEAVSEDQAMSFIQKVWFAPEQTALSHTLFAGGEVVAIEREFLPEMSSFGYEIKVLDYEEGSQPFQEELRKEIIYNLRSNEPLTDEERQAYTQLPSGLPARVGQLAQDWTAQAESREERILLLLKQLRSQFPYRMSGSRVPDSNQDFVDHFLFEQQFGYCDHFSTSFVVMLRTLEIPARWVKGFHTGEIVKYPSQTNSFYELKIRNRDAHSWVEVYLDGVGWIALDPTPSAELTGDVLAASAKVVGTNEYGVSSDHSSKLSEWLGKLALVKIWFIHLYTNAKDVLLSVGMLLDDMKLGWWAAGLGVVAFFGFSLSKGIGTMTALAGRVISHHRENILYEQERLLKRMYRKFGTPARHETVREYIEQLIQRYPDKEMELERWLEIYERVRYAREHEHRTLNDVGISRKELQHLYRRICGRET